mmetsp:Transcript_6875/g.15687  ORF Transcript_6875/g.15687 Transcript_6875/m.15687 type:complete len:236 (-) Transcript_6875:785-1492(-)
MMRKYVCVFVNLRGQCCFQNCSGVFQWVACHACDAAHAARRHACREADVAIFTPLIAPRILHDPVVGSVHVVIRAVSHEQNAMVKLCATIDIREDAAAVQLKIEVIRLDGDAHRLLRNSLHERHLAPRFHVFVSINRRRITPDASGITQHLARLEWIRPLSSWRRSVVTLRLVCPVAVRVEPTVAFNPRKGVVHDPATASHITLRVAVEKLLLTQAHSWERIRRERLNTLHRRHR